MNRFSEVELKLQLSALFVLSRVAFAASCCERLIPHYLMFSESVHWGDPKLMRTALDEVWNALESGLFDIARIRALLEQCERIIPDTEDFTSLHTSPALDAATSIVATLECCLDGESEHAVEVAIASRDTVDMYILSGLEGFNSEDVVERHPLMRSELARMSEDIQTLNNISVFDGEFIKRFRQQAASRGSSLSLDREDRRS